MYIRAQAAQTQKHIAQHIEPVFFPGPSGFEDCAFCLSPLAFLYHVSPVPVVYVVPVSSDGPFLAVFALTPFQQQPIFKTSKVSRIRIRIYHVNIAHAQSARRTRTDGGTDGRTREPLTSSMEGLAHARPNNIQTARPSRNTRWARSRSPYY